MTNVFSKMAYLGLMLSLLGVSQNCLAHSGVHSDSLLHSMLHVVLSAMVAIAVIGVSFLLVKRFPKAIKIRVKK